MTLRAFLSLLRDELRSTVTTRGYETRAGVPSSLGAVPPPPAAVEGEGAHPGEVGHSASPRAVGSPRDASRPKVERWFDALFLIAGKPCIYNREGRACRLLPDLERGLWCPACLATEALNPGEVRR